MFDDQLSLSGHSPQPSDSEPDITGLPTDGSGSFGLSDTCLAPMTNPDTWQFLSCGVDTLHLGLGIEYGQRN